MINALIYDAGGGGLYIECQFPSGPSDYLPTQTRVQPSDISRGGSLYLYDRGVQFTTHKLTYSDLTDDHLDWLEQIIDQASGAAFATVDWFDAQAATHRVRFKGAATYKETSPGKYRASFTLEEY